jgi:uroporphyrinogen decarboxylase
MLTHRERVITALNFNYTDRVPKDLGGMRSTSISAFAYPHLVKALGLPPRLPRVEDTGQMLALPDLDVLDALGCDLVTICDEATNAFHQPDLWKPYNFNGRLPALVRCPKSFTSQADGSILQGNTRMVPTSYVFDEPHGGQPLQLDGDLPMLDLKKFRKERERSLLSDEQIRSKVDLCKRVRESTDRAVFYNDGSIQTPICIHGYGGLAVFPVLCLTEPNYVTELHEIATEYTIKNIRALLPEINPYIDVIMMNADDWGTQNNLIASPTIFRNLFLPFRKTINDFCHSIAPQVKLFLHSCGAIYDLLDLIIESGFDAVNPVQWPAGKHTYREWKDKCQKRITLWGGGVNSQHTLPLGSVDEIENEVYDIVKYMKHDGGYVFCNIHNILAEIPPEKIIALYRSAAEA